MKTLLIINPISGTRSKDDIEERVRRHLEPAGFELDIVYTEHAGHGAELAARAAADGYYAVLAAGGDGTVNEIASALRSTDTVLGILPYGSGNGLARHLYGSIDVDRALDVIAKNRPLPCDYGTVNDRPFFCTFGLGFDASVSHTFAHMRRRGLLSYLRSMMRVWIKYTPQQYDIEFDGRKVTVNAFCVTVCNASQYGNNAFIAPKASVQDGLLDIMIIHGGNPLTQAIVGADLITGNIERNMIVQKFSVRDARITQKPGPGHIDGEPCSMPESISIICHHGDIRIFADPAKQPLRPFITLFKSMRLDTRYIVREKLRLSKKKIFGKKHGNAEKD